MTADAEHLAHLIRSTPARRPNPDTIAAALVLDTTARLFGVTAADILSGSHARRHVEPRMVAMAVLRANSTMSYPEIGRAFGRDHTTVMSAIDRVASSDVMRGWASAVDLEVASAAVAPPAPTRRCSKPRPPTGGSA